MAKPAGAFQLFKPSMEAVLNNFASFLVIIFLPAFLLLIGEVMNVGDTLSSAEGSLWAITLDNVRPESVPFYVGGVLLSVLLLPAGYYLELQAARGKKLSAAEALSGSARYLWKIIGFGLLIALGALLGIMVVIGLFTLLLAILGQPSHLLGLPIVAALVILAVIIIQRYFLVPYFLVDQGTTIRKAMTDSATAARGHALAIWGVIGVCVGLSFFGIIPVFGGLVSLTLLTLYTCAPALRYLELSSHAASAAAPKAPKGL